MGHSEQRQNQGQPHARVEGEQWPPAPVFTCESQSRPGPDSEQEAGTERTSSWRTSVSLLYLFLCLDIMFGWYGGNELEIELFQSFKF